MPKNIGMGVKMSNVRYAISCLRSATSEADSALDELKEAEERIVNLIDEIDKAIDFPNIKDREEALKEAAEFLRELI